ncbi:MAG: acyl-CoA dehydrogenase family protein [Alcanivorax sp.]|nr:acyl-CoA dehydrogenase family protein [Alcanivorax sp.]
MVTSQDLPFDLSLSEEQRIGRESMRRYAERQLRAIARSADEAGAAPEGFYAGTMELGLSLMPIPEAFGGAGMPRSPVSNVLNAEDLGHGDISLALGTLAPLSFINALLDFGDEAQQELFLPQLAQEHFVPATVALMEPRATFDPGNLHTRAVRDGDGYLITGEKSMVILGASAELILVVAELDGEGPAAFVVPAGSEGLSAKAESYMGLRAVEVATLTLNQVRVGAAHRLMQFDLERLVDLGRIGTAALAVGCCQAVLDYCIPYVKERKAFGEPIAWRQSVAFMVADIAIELEGMRLLVLRAASRAEQGLPFHREAHLARVYAAEKAMQIGTNGVQLFGGAGFVRDYPLEMWYRNLRAIGVLDGAALV